MPIRGNYNPGAGGWPTIRYFNAKTGYEGAPYQKKTSAPMCTELGSEENMQAYVEEAGATSLCSAADPEGTGCNEKEVAYIAKMKAAPAADVAAQLTRLQQLLWMERALDMCLGLTPSFRLPAAVAAERAQLAKKGGGRPNKPPAAVEPQKTWS